MSGYFFDEPHTKADFDYWSKVPNWSLDEIVALSLGKDPRFVSSDKFGHGTRGNDFSATFFERLDLAERARESGILTERSPATAAVKWAEAAGFAFPKDLIEKVRQFARRTKRKSPIAPATDDPNPTDLETRVELISSKKPNELPASQIKTETKMHEETAHDPEFIDTGIDGSVGPLERNSFLKLFVGLAALHYDYDPSLNRNSCASRMSEALKGIRITLGDDTIRRLLNEGNEFLPADAIRIIKAAKAEKA